LDSLKISGAIHGPNAIWRGNVEIANDGEEALDLTQVSALQIDGRLTLDNVRVTRVRDGSVEVKSI
jgi:hypothetical protein